MNLRSRSTIGLTSFCLSASPSSLDRRDDDDGVPPPRARAPRAGNWCCVCFRIIYRSDRSAFCATS